MADLKFLKGSQSSIPSITDGQVYFIQGGVSGSGRIYFDSGTKRYMMNTFLKSIYLLDTETSTTPAKITYSKSSTEDTITIEFNK